MKKVKWGVMGTAGIAKKCTIPGMLEADNCELYAIAGRNKEKAQEFKERFGFIKAYDNYESLLEDEDVTAVYIALPNQLHYEWTLKALQKRKHVLCEKPMTPSKQQTKALHDAAKKNGVFLMEAFAYLHSPYMNALKRELAQNVIGNVSYIETAFLTSTYNFTNIRMQKACYGGAMYDLGCYCTSLILYLLEKEPKSVKGIAEFSEDGIDLLTSVIIGFEDGVRASFRCGMNLDKENKQRFDQLYIQGSKGAIYSNVKYNESGELHYTICKDGTEEIRVVQAPHNYRLEVEQMGRCILDGEKVPVSEAFSIKNAELIDRILGEIGY